MRKIKELFIFLIFVCFIVFSDIAYAEWELTQYADDSGNQAMCYSLYNEDINALILVDGGWPENANHVRQIIDEHGGRVTAWFLTHYHNDHCEAFNTLWDEYKDRIDQVYCTPLTWNDVKDVFQWWDSPETFKVFLEQTENAENVTRLYRDDEFNIYDLSIKIYSAFDEEITSLGDIPNNCSLVFKISASEQSVLFMGDTHNAGHAMRLLERYGAEELHADYVQAGHHGNNTQPYAFFQEVNPSVIFLDGPEWLMTGENYNAKDLLMWCKEQGIMTYDYRQAPTTLFLK